MLAAAALLPSAFLTPRVPWILKTAVIGMAALAVSRPADALLVFAGLVPFAFALTTTVWPAYPFGFDEALALAFLAGYCGHRALVSAARPSAPPADSTSVAARLFVVVVLASAIVQFSVVQVWHDYPVEYARYFLKFLWSEYLTTIVDRRPWVDGRAFVGTAALLIDGVAIFGCARALCNEHAGLGRRLTNVIAIAATGVAVLTMTTTIGAALERNWSTVETISNARYSSPAIPSINTAGVYLLLGAFLTFGTAAVSSPWAMLGWMAAGYLCAIGIGLTGTRAAIVSGVAVGVVALAVARSSRVRSWSPHRAALGGIALAVIIGAGIILFNPFDMLNNDVAQSLRMRTFFVQTGLKMMGSAPIAGVGVGQYENRYLEFRIPELRRYYAPTTAENAHNYFLWIGAELGIIGIGLFLWFLGAALARMAGRIRAPGTDYWRLGLTAGLVAFVITWTTGQPLLVPAVAYTFWILFGAAAAPMAASRAQPDERRRQILAWGSLAAAALLVVTLPVRVHGAISDIDLSRISYGFEPWEKTANGEPFRWTGPRATFFVRSAVRGIDLPFPRNLLAAPDGVRVDIFTDGRLAEHVELRYGEGRTAQVAAPPVAGPFWRVDLRISPTWVPQHVIPNSQDGRELGVPVAQFVPH
jgi:O-antigen ligase